MPKAQKKKQQKIIEDRTFGLKNSKGSLKKNMFGLGQNMRKFVKLINEGREKEIFRPQSSKFNQKQLALRIEILSQLQKIKSCKGFESKRKDSLSRSSKNYPKQEKSLLPILIWTQKLLTALRKLQIYSLLQKQNLVTGIFLKFEMENIQRSLRCFYRISILKNTISFIKISYSCNLQNYEKDSYCQHNNSKSYRKYFN